MIARHRTSALAAVVWSALASTGCTLVNAPGEHRAPISAADFCGPYARVACEAHYDCCPASRQITLSFDECVDAISRECAMGFGPLAIDPRTGYSPEAAARIVAEGRSYVATCDVGIRDWYTEREGFQSVLEGSVAGGEPCGTPSLSDFAPIFSCERRDQACVQGTGSEFECLARRGVGERCLLYWDCEPAMYCAGIFGFGTCQPRLALGAVCGNDVDCQSLVCVAGTCQARTVEEIYCELGRPAS
jgi:hypothetical protein